MSKIYEALLRAELERAVSTGQPESAAPIAVDDLLRPAEEALPLSGPDPVALETSTELNFLGDPSLEEITPALDLSRVVQRSWHPSVAGFPALAERGAEIEQFRSLRSHLTEFRDQGPMKTILVSSGLPGEGKSYVALNLALSLGRRKGNRVLLIDGDMRRSSLHKALGAPREPGMTEFLSGEASLTEVMQRPQAIAGTPMPTGLASLFFIPGGKDSDKAGDLAASTRFAELIAKVKSTFEWIVIDSSPANLVSDAVSLARACDGVLLVARDGITKYKTAQQAQAQFKTSTVLGFVLNAVHKPPVKSDYYGGYENYRAEA